MKSKTAFEKISKTHMVKVLTDGRMVLRLDRIWGHEITTPNGILDAELRGCDVVFDPNKIKTMVDHVSPSKDTASAIQAEILRNWSKKHDIEFLEVGRNGICHAIIPEKGWVAPGEIGIMGDSHTCTHGAFGAFAAGVGTTDLEAGIITGLWVCPPQKVIRVNFEGNMPREVFAKDLILALIKKLGVDGAINAVLEYGGSVIKKLSMDARMTITNLSVEMGATSGMMAVDENTIRYLWPVLEKYYASPKQALIELSKWNSDLGCRYDQELTINVDNLVPLITQNYLPSDVVPVQTLAGKPVNQVYIGSCTNGRLEDLRIAASFFKMLGKPVAQGVRCIVVPATQHIWQQAMKEGLLGIFTEAGCCVTNPTCGACLGMSNGVLAPGEVCVSTTNRNFSNRMGQGGMVHLASPATAVITAVNSVISVPDFSKNTPIIISNARAEPSEWEEKPVPKIDYSKLQVGGPKPIENFSGQVFYLKVANVDTDQIIEAKYLNEIDKKELAKHCLDNVRIPDENDPDKTRTFNENERLYLKRCQVLVTLKNFGCGSSREHAPWALHAIGINCVIAPSFARIFYESMFNNGLLCIEASQEDIETLLKENPREIHVNWKTSEFYRGGGGQPFRFSLTQYERERIQNGGAIRTIVQFAAEAQTQQLKKRKGEK
ncbi:MAG: 3-isopropylmalate dehydratase small subunit [bacterium]|nr:3-isopropylmalate dehydratase small subunit [bacterium]